MLRIGEIRFFFMEKLADLCECSVIIDVDQLLKDRALEQKPVRGTHSIEPLTPASIDKGTRSSKRVKAARLAATVKNEEFDLVLSDYKSSKKRKVGNGEGLAKAKKIKVSQNKSSSSSSTVVCSPELELHGPKLSVTLKLPPQYTGPESFPCCLCVSQSRENLLRVYDPPVSRKDAAEATGNPKVWMVHEQCAKIVPETWVDEVDGGPIVGKEKMVFGVDGIVKDRWHLVRLLILFAISPSVSNVELTERRNRNVPGAPEISRRLMGHPCSALRANVRKPFMSHVPRIIRRSCLRW